MMRMIGKDGNDEVLCERVLLRGGGCCGNPSNPRRRWRKSNESRGVILFKVIQGS